jgi:shikimate kinase
MDKRTSKEIKGNIALIGMAGVGKSFIGKHLADRIGYNYVETDRIITSEAKKIGVKKDSLSDKEFIKLEERAILSLKNKINSVFDTGGSVVYSEKSMESLISNSIIIYLKDGVSRIKKRFDERGDPHLIGINGKSFKELFRERDKLYEKYADFVINVAKHKKLELIISEILDKIQLTL